MLVPVLLAFAIALSLEGQLSHEASSATSSSTSHSSHSLEPVIMADHFSAKEPFSCHYPTTDHHQSAAHGSRLYDCVKRLKQDEQKLIIVTGGCGFVGSHLVDSLMLDGHKVIVVDNLLTGRTNNIEHWLKHDNFTLIRSDVAESAWLTQVPDVEKIDQLYHLASPASPKHYQLLPIETIQVNTFGTMHVLQLAQRTKARVLLASTSEVYGSPSVHPQPESYWGNVNPIGPRSSYDESKRLAEAMAVAYRDQRNVSIGIARIFNTYGPRMRSNDGRVVSNLVTQAIKSKPMTIYGDGSQTRSFQYIDDLVIGLKKLMASNVMTPVNLGNPNEQTILQLGTLIRSLLGQSNHTSDFIVFHKLPVDDPPRRRPNISLAENLLDWRPSVDLDVGLTKTIDYFKIALKDDRVTE